MRKLFTYLLVLSMVLAIASFGNAAPKTYVGISMPTQSSERWIKDGGTMKTILEKKGYRVDLQFAEDDIPTQKAQIENMISKGANVLVIAAVDGSTLSATLTAAAKDGVKVISYDRLLVNTDAVSYYATFDNRKVGQLQAQSLVEGLRKYKGKGPYNVELFAGSPDDTNSYYFYQGAMDVLKPLMDKGTIVVPSKQIAQDKIGTLRWLGDVAQARMDALLAANYSGGKRVLHGVLSPYDGISRGILSALISFGYTPGNNFKNLPIVTGQDAEAASIKLIIARQQYSTILKDTRDLAKVASDMVDAVLKGTEPQINDTKTYNNNVKVVPSYLLTPHIVTVSNYKKLVIDSGYLKPSDIK
ncbi:multiple monosaccharide-binding protein [Hydrogenispora ethanolica]|uniref:Multiple monosaccharide-binding protein n=1 Tax=Hydrogenispora ethanolica TaxID=1082276 RepID=A0A4R1QSE8_HYDET|nr:multiple monosaccharide ABC transporter substrate-binding protein [Hydrogenispora ethanolica]TCL55365.1 multiple monosaccharide-binding protein [Hydrogenispora ethanolica]